MDSCALVMRLNVGVNDIRYAQKFSVPWVDVAIPTRSVYR